MRQPGVFAAGVRTWNKKDIKALQTPWNSALLSLIGLPRYALHLYHVPLPRLHRLYRCESIESTIRYLQCSEVGHLIRSPQTRLAREALFGFFTLGLPANEDFILYRPQPKSAVYCGMRCALLSLLSRLWS